MSTSKSSDPTFLDVEDDEQRENRIGSLLERLNATSPPKSVAPDPLLNIGRENVIGPTGPPTELLARVQSFLTTIAASNEAISQENPEDIDIENVPENVEEYIEMVPSLPLTPSRAPRHACLPKALQNLGLGVFETKRPKSGSRSVTPSSEAIEPSSDETSSDSEPYSSCSGSEDGTETSSSNDDSDPASDSEQSGSSVDIKPIFSRPIKPLPRRVSQQAKMGV